MQKERIRWIDALRAWAMLSVVLTHLYDGRILYYTVTDPVKLPLFYFLAGYVFNADKTWRTFRRGLFFRIYIPYLIFSLLPLKVLRFLLLGNTSALLDYLAAFFSGSIFWFVPSFIITQLLVFLLHRLFRGNPKLIGAASALCFLIGVRSAEVEWMDLWCINTALTAVLYMNFGLFVKQYGAAFRLRSGRAIAVNAFVYLCGVVCSLWFYTESFMDVHLIRYYNVPLCLILIFSGICMMVGLAQRIPWGKAAAPWLWLGQETLIVFLMHGALQVALTTLLRPILPYHSEDFWSSLFYAILTCLVGTILSKGIGRFIPELAGKQRTSSKESQSGAGVGGCSKSFPRKREERR